MKFKKGQIVTITNEQVKGAQYDKHNGTRVKIEGVNTFLNLYEVTLGGVAWAVREEGLKK